MSKIDYHFIPFPTYFWDTGWLSPKKDGDHFKRLSFLFWCFSRCSTETRIIFHDHKEIVLQPFEFIFGRRICSEETGLTEREVRTYIDQLTQNDQLFPHPFGKMLEKTTNSVTNRFTCYRWLTERFSNKSDQHKDQPATNRRPTGDHNLEDKKKKYIKGQCTNEAIVANDEHCVASFSKEKEISIFERIKAYKFPGTTTQTISYWIKTYPKNIQDVIFFYEFEMKRGMKFTNPGGFFRNCLDGNYKIVNPKTLDLKQFAEEYKELHNWKDLEIKLKLVRCKNIDKELYFEMNPNEFIDALQRMHEQSENYATIGD